jgi:prepilin-type processing-associated H-X9-DG protein/prepilin-type N-terminal cleavage/methylation domain-containing protein
MTTPHNIRTSTRRSRTAAFTLTELLTVIAIIGILAAILIPTLSKVRASAQLVECTTNLKALHQGFTLYANDNKGVFPAVIGNTLPTGGTGSWMLALQQRGYFDNQQIMVGVKNVFRCPTAEETYTAGARRTYTMNSLLKGQTLAIVANQVVAPARPLLLIDGKDAGVEGDAWLSFTEASYATRTDFRHGGGANTLFVDGHVAIVHPNDPQLPLYVKNINP